MPDDKNVIIVVDDDEAVRKSLKFSLELDGMDVRLCDSAASLLKNPALKEAACLVVDYHMPETDGFALRQALAARDISTPVIMITAPVNSDLRRRARKAGFYTVLEKPLLDNVLLQSVRAAISH